MNTYLAVALGGALGAMSRYFLTQSLARLDLGNFPWGTFLVNVLGSLFIGMLFVLFTERSSFDLYRPLLTIGFLGSLTTFSTFSLDALLLFQQGHYNTALFYVLGSVALCLLSALAGMQLTRSLL